MPRRRTKLRIGVIGAGRVGSTLACLLHRNGHRVVSVVSRRSARARALARRVGCRHTSTDPRTISPDADVIIIATPDRAVASVARLLGTKGRGTSKRRAVFHTSGLLTSDALSPVTRRGDFAFSLHPIFAFPRPMCFARDLRGLSGLVFAFQGPRRTLPAARRIVKALGGQLAVLPKEEKILYHAACVYASNFVVVQLAVASGLLGRTTSPRIRRALFRLASAAIREAERTGAGRALTGPVVRGDVETIRAHLSALRRRNRAEWRLYREVSCMALRIAESRRTPTTAQRKQLYRLLS